jgi:hypothetical protein
VIDYPGLLQKIQVSRDGGQAPRWRADGGELYFTASDDSMDAVSVDTSEGRLIVAEPSGLFATPSRVSRTHLYAVSPDGDFFYVIESGYMSGNDVFSVLVGWPDTVHGATGK